MKIWLFLVVTSSIISCFVSQPTNSSTPSGSHGFWKLKFGTEGVCGGVNVFACVGANWLQEGTEMGVAYRKKT